MIGARLQRVLNRAVSEVRRRRHEYLTVEHVLYAMTGEMAGRVLIEGCGANPDVVRKHVEQFFEAHLQALPESEPTDEIDVVQTLSVQRMMENAVRHIQAAGRNEVDLGDILAAIMDEEESYACYFLRRQGVTRLDVLTFISHAMERESSNRKETSDERDEEGGGDALARFTVDLTAKARSGELDPLIGRELEVDRTIEVLCRRRKNNPLFVGDPGVGKTALAEGLALRIASGNVPEMFRNTRIFSLDLGALLAGSRYRGDFEARMKSVIAAVSKIPDAIMFIDEIHTIVGAGSTSGGSMDASNLLKPVLASGKMRCIGSTTHEEFRNYLEKDRALSRRFQRIDIKEPSKEECLEILKGLLSHYEKHHRVRYASGALKAMVDLSARHIQERPLPDKAIDVLDESGALARLRSKSSSGGSVSVKDVEKIVARIAGIPERSVSGREKARLATLKEDLQKAVFGQDEALELTVRAILRSRAGLAGRARPSGSFLFYGPTGVGKTEVAKQLAEHLGINFLRFDMSEYMEKHAVSRLIGAPPGYVGFDQGGQLTEAVRKSPYAVVLLDEIEKAHPDIFNILLQVMDYATLTDNTGRKADFSNVILIMTTNAGAREMASASIGFGDSGKTDSAAKSRKALENTFSPEFRNRLDAMVPFGNLTLEMVERIVDKTVGELAKNLGERKITIHLGEGARRMLALKGYDPVFGARPLQRLIREEVEDALAGEMLFGKLAKGGTVTVNVDTAPDADDNALKEGKLVFVYE